MDRLGRNLGGHIPSCPRHDPPGRGQTVLQVDRANPDGIRFVGDTTTSIRRAYRDVGSDHASVKSVSPFIACLGSSSSVVRRQPSSPVYRRLQSVVRHVPSLSAVIRPFYIAARLRHRQRFARQLEQASSSSVVSQAVHRAVVCWSKEDTFIPFYTAFELSVKFPFDHFYN